MDFRGRSDMPVNLSQILAMLLNPFYYGEFQYPEAPDGRWFKGAHKPLIFKDLFDQVQQTRGVNKGVWGSKQFAFRGLISCGSCGAAFTAQEKFKKLKSGEFNRRVYYSCTRRVDPNCKEKYINETNLMLMLQEFIEKNEKKLKITDALRAKIERHFGATSSLFTHYNIAQPLSSPLIEYTRYVLDNGAKSERAALSKGITTKLTIKEGMLFFS